MKALPLTLSSTRWLVRNISGEGFVSPFFPSFLFFRKKFLFEFLKQFLRYTTSTLEQLKLLECEMITTEGFSRLSSLKHLKYLHLRNNQHVQDDAIIRLLEESPGIVRLGLMDCPGLTDDGFCRLPPYLTVREERREKREREKRE